MPELLTPDFEALKVRSDAFARDTLLPLAGQPPATAHAAVLDGARSAGLYAMTQPRQFGGTEASPLALVVARETLASHNPPYLHRVFGPGPGVLAGCGEPLATTHLMPLINGEKRSAFGFTEPDDAERHTWAAQHGDTLVVNGAKSYVTGGADADFVNTLVEIEGQGKAMVVIDTDTPGVTRDRLFESLDGSRHAAFAFRDVHVPVSHVVGEPGGGLPRAMRQILDTRLAIAAECSGLALWVLGFLEAHLADSHPSGRPLADREGVRLRYAELRIPAYAGRSMLYRTARLADAGENIVNEGIACKVFLTETIGRLVDGAIQLVGGNALVTDHPLASLYRRVRSLRLAEGATDVLKLNLSRGRFDLQRGRV